MLKILSTFALVASTGMAMAGEADVIDAKAAQSSQGNWQVSATIRHADAGWDHYANRFEVLDMQDNVLGIRELAHPHVNEQPFTRSLSGVKIPAGIRKIKIRARDSVHGYGGKEYVVELGK